MSLRDAIIDCLQCDRDSYGRHLEEITRTYGLTTGTDETGCHDELSTVELSPDEQEILRRVQHLDTIPLGLTLAGPAYQDNPIIYANKTFREFTGYPLSSLIGQNPRLLQGPDTEPEAIETLHEAIDIWEPRTVELWNYRQDGTRFRNRVSVVPLTDGSGMISNWLGVQKPVAETAPWSR
jgi:PAS domain S-box-containing protein